MYGWSGGLGTLTDQNVVIGPDGEPRVVTSGPITTVDVLGSGTDVYHDSTGAIIGTGSPSSSSPFTSWLNQNSTAVAVGAGGFVLLLLFAKAGR